MRWVFSVMLVVYLIVIGVICVFSWLPPEGATSLLPESPITFIPIAFNFASGALALGLLGMMFGRIAQGVTPFSGGITRLLCILGFVLLVVFVSEALIPAGTQIGAVGDASTMSFDFGSSDTGIVSLDAKSLLASIFCLSLAAIFKYGTVLQEEADDLM